MFVLKSQIKKLLDEAEQKGYERGCLDGYKNCEEHQRGVVQKIRELTRQPFQSAKINHSEFGER